MQHITLKKIVTSLRFFVKFALLPSCLQGAFNLESTKYNRR